METTGISSGMEMTGISSGMEMTGNIGWDGDNRILGGLKTTGNIRQVKITDSSLFY